MTTWANARCTETGPNGETCALPAGHAGDHASAPPSAPTARQSTVRGPSIGRMAATPIAILIAGIAFALLLGPAYLWIGGALVVAIAYLLAANGQRR